MNTSKLLFFILINLDACIRILRTKYSSLLMYAYMQDVWLYPNGGYSDRHPQPVVFDVIIIPTIVITRRPLKHVYLITRLHKYTLTNTQAHIHTTLLTTIINIICYINFDLKMFLYYKWICLPWNIVHTINHAIVYVRVWVIQPLININIINMKS